jgi:hypothetical protein
MKIPGLKGALGEVTAVLGGPWGAAFAVAAGAILAFQGWIDSTRVSVGDLTTELKNGATGTELMKSLGEGWQGIENNFQNAMTSTKSFTSDLRLIAEDPWAKGWSLEAQQVESNLGRVGESLGFAGSGEPPGGAGGVPAPRREGGWLAQGDAEPPGGHPGVPEGARRPRERAGHQRHGGGRLDRQEQAPRRGDGRGGRRRGDRAGQQGENNKTLETLQGKAADAKLGLDTLKSAIQGFGSAALDSREANRQLYESIQTATDTIRENGKATDDSTEAGRENNAALDGIARAAIAAAAATANQTGSQEKATEKMKEGRQAFTDAAIAAGYGADEANRMADELGLIPENVHTAFTVSIDWDQVNAYVKKLNDIPAFKSTVINQVVKTTGAPHGQVGAAYDGMAQANGGIVRAFANGGIPRQPMIARGGANILWAEPETGWEAYISGKPGHERDNANVWLEAGQRLGLLGDGGGGGTNITITVQGGGDPAVWMDELVSKLRFAMGD